MLTDHCTGKEERILYTNFKNTDHRMYDYVQSVRYFFMMVEYLMVTHGTFDGVVLTMNSKGINWRHIAKSPMNTMKKLLGFVQVRVPCRSSLYDSVLLYCVCAVAAAFRPVRASAFLDHFFVCAPRDRRPSLPFRLHPPPTVEPGRSVFTRSRKNTSKSVSVVRTTNAVQIQFNVDLRGGKASGRSGTCFCRARSRNDAVRIYCRLYILSKDGKHVDERYRDIRSNALIIVFGTGIE